MIRTYYTALYDEICHIHDYVFHGGEEQQCDFLRHQNVQPGRWTPAFCLYHLG